MKKLIGLLLLLVSLLLYGAVSPHGTGPTSVLGPQTNSSAVNVGGGQTNWTSLHVVGTANFRSNAVVSAGIGASSNAWVGGTYFQQSAMVFTNLNGTPTTLTNLATVTVTGNTLTNTGDRVVGEWGIKLQNAKANTNRFLMFYGSSTLLDTTLTIMSNTSVKAGCTIIRNSDGTSQHAEAWLRSGSNHCFSANIEIAETNGIATVLGIQGAAQAVGAHTNNYFAVEWKPGSR